jgi:hypothetical protein
MRITEDSALLNGHHPHPQRKPGNGPCPALGLRLLVWSLPVLLILALYQVVIIPRSTATTIAGADGFQSAFPNSLYNNNGDPNAPCTPRKLHLSQASNVFYFKNNDDDDDDDYSDGMPVVNFTLSFTVSSGHPECRTAKPYLIYGRMGGADDDDDESYHHIEGVVTESEVVHFDYVSTPNNREHYSSDWIHHMVIPKIKAGRVQYWYRVFMVAAEAADDGQQQQTTKTTAHHRSSSSSSSLLLLSLLEASSEKTIDHPHASSFLLRKNQQHQMPSTILGETPSSYPFWTTPTYDQPTSLALVGDLGQTENSTKTMHHIYQAAHVLNGTNPPVSALLIAGDMSYADGDPHRWESWFELMVRTSKGVLYLRV